MPVRSIDSATLLRALSLAYRTREWLRSRRPDELRVRRERSRFYRSAWKQAAESVGATLEALDDDILEICSDSCCTRVRQNSTAAEDPVTIRAAANKPLVHRLLEKRGLPVPEYTRFTLSQLSDAKRFLRRAGTPCVVKPANSGGGLGVTTNIVRMTSLVYAAAVAAAYSPELMIEKQVEGDVYRLLYFDGDLIDAIVRKPPIVVGDGRSTVRELIAQENLKRHSEGAKLAHVLISVDLDATISLQRQTLTLGSVPAAGRSVVVKTVVNQNSSTCNLAARELLCDSLIASGAAAAAAVGARFAGVDIITRDPGRPLADTGGVILEVNTTPSFQQHYFRRGDPCDVAQIVLRRLLVGRPAVHHSAAAASHNQNVPSSHLGRA